MAHRARLSTWIAVALLVIGTVLVATRWRVTTALTEFAARFGLRTHVVQLAAGLHLKSACTMLDAGTDRKSVV